MLPHTHTRLTTCALANSTWSTETSMSQTPFRQEILTWIHHNLLRSWVPVSLCHSCYCWISNVLLNQNDPDHVPCIKHSIWTVDPLFSIHACILLLFCWCRLSVKQTKIHCKPTPKKVLEESTPFSSKTICPKLCTQLPWAFLPVWMWLQESHHQICPKILSDCLNWDQIPLHAFQPCFFWPSLVNKRPTDSQTSSSLQNQCSKMIWIIEALIFSTPNKELVSSKFIYALRWGKQIKHDALEKSTQNLNNMPGTVHMVQKRGDIPRHWLKTKIIFQTENIANLQHPNWNFNDADNSKHYLSQKRLKCRITCCSKFWNSECSVQNSILTYFQLCAILWKDSWFR